MIIARLIGGLGNQLFQYALGRHLAYKNNTELKLDIGGFETYTLHKYSLNHFNVSAGIALDKDLVFLKIKKRSGFPAGIFKILDKFHLRRNKFHIKEHSSFSFDSAILSLPDNVYLDGYWQSEKYFKSIDNIIRKEITLREPLDFDGQKFARAIQSSQSISIHIRQADYASNLETRLVYGLLNLDYYYQAARQIARKVINPRFFIFSDDIDWVKDNLKLDYPAVFSRNNADKNYEDLHFMSLCKHNIVANSSFSWWGAWLNKNPEKIVFAPSKWFNFNSADTRDLLPESWIKI